MILVTTSTGDIGARVVQQLLDAGAPVRVICRNPAQLPPAISARVDVVPGSHSDRTALDRALPGVTGVFWLPPGGPAHTSATEAYVEFSRPFCTALPYSDVTHVVGVSALGRGWPKPAGHVTASVRMDDMIAATAVGYRALACASLMDNLLRQATLIQTQGVFYAPVPSELRLPHVAKHDVATVAARLLLSRTWSGADEVPLIGPEDLSFNTMASTMSDVLGTTIQFREMTMEQFRGMMVANGTSEGMASAYVEMMTAKNEGMDTAHRPASRVNTPTTFRQWCEQELRPIVRLLGTS